jgi:glutathione peroxidase
MEVFLMTQSIYDFTVKSQKGEDVSLSQYKGKVLLVVNTATGCGFTPQYQGLQDLYSKYQKDGFEILDFPCDQFAHQAPGSDEEIHSFCTGRFGIKFPQFSKIKVNGNDADPLYKYLREEKKGAIGASIKWNFTKFLIARDGTVLKRFAPVDTPEKIEQDIVNELKK